MVPPFPPALGHGASGDRAGVGMAGEAGGTCVCLGGCSATFLYAAMQGVLVGWQSFVPLALLGAGHSPRGGCFVSQKSILISLCKYQVVRVQIRVWALVVWSVHHWHCVPGQSSLELGLLDLPSVAATMVCPGTDRTRTVATCCFLAKQRWEGGRGMHLK